MAFQVKHENGEYELILSGESAKATSLRAKPSEREALISGGVWLVLVFAVWSSPDRRAIEMALREVETLGGVRLGIRPFDSHTELGTWCPEMPETWGSPVWIVLHDGRLVAHAVGMISAEELRMLVWRSSGS